MYKVVVIGGGWSGCAAALAARNAGAEVTLLEKTDLLLGLGNVGGIMRNNGRFTAAEENIALGAGELFAVTDRCSRHINIDFPGHKHASLYDVTMVEPNVRRLLREKGVDVKLMARAVDVVTRPVNRWQQEQQEITIEKIVLAGGEEIEGDVFVETTGSTGPCQQTTKNGTSVAITGFHPTPRRSLYKTENNKMLYRIATDCRQKSILFL